jgi:DNA anti-recombination protein RmuC
MEITYGIVILVLIASVVGAFFLGKKQTTALVEQSLNQLEKEKEEHRRALEKETLRDKELREELKTSYEKQLAETKGTYERRLAETKDTFEHRIAETKQEHENQLAALRRTNQEQLEAQMQLIKEQMQTTSEAILKKRQEELKTENREQVSQIIDPLKQSLNLMSQALQDSKEKHQEALTRLDATIKANMLKSENLSQSADRLARALTGEVKVQGNFGELKLKQLLEDLGLKDGEQYSSQEHLRDELGNAIKDDEGKGLIPDFILHFPNKRDVIVDSKMSFTAYERYVNCEDPAEQSMYLKEHIASVRAQVDRLSRKDYSRYLPKGVNKLNFVIMYIHTEGALNLALSNDTALWREAYDKNVLILGPQTMYMNLRILEMMWTQVRQLNNQEEMIAAANLIVERTQDFCQRFGDVEKRMNDTIVSMGKLRISVQDSGPSIVTAARKLISAGAKESKKKKVSLTNLELDAEDSED